MPVEASEATVTSFKRRVTGNVEAVFQSCRSIILASRLGVNEAADRQATELLVHVQQIVAASEDLLRLVNELKLSRMLMDWKKHDEKVAAEQQKLETREKQDRETLLKVTEEVKELLLEIELHRNLSRSKRLRS